tara:strand:- start:1833 stop:2336 length:504 start_codon:yes stop_codon:yes gene_type:complete
MFDKVFNFVKDFSMDKALDTVINYGADLVLGKKEYGYDISTGRMTEERSGSGFLDLVSTGAKHYMDMKDDKDSQYFGVPEVEAFEARSRYRPTAGGLAGGQTRWSPRSPQFQDALRRRLQNQNFETNLETKTAQYTVRPTKGRTRPVSPGTTSIKRTMAAPRIKTGD